MIVSIHSRKSVETLIRCGNFQKNAALISFYDPLHTAPPGYAPVDYSETTDPVFYAAVPDLDWDAFENDAGGLHAFFPQAPDLAAFIKTAHQNGYDFICQCDYGQSRSAGCAMAILEFYEHAGQTIFEDPRYFPNQLIFGKVLAALNHGNKRKERACSG